MAVEELSGKAAARRLEEFFGRVVGKRVRRAVPSPDGATIEIGKSMRDTEGAERAEWYLWLRYADWSLEREGQVVCRSEDDELGGFGALVGTRLTAARIAGPRHDLDLQFGSLRLATSSDASDPNSEMWWLFTPENLVFRLRADGTLTVAPSNEK